MKLASLERLERGKLYIGEVNISFGLNKLIWKNKSVVEMKFTCATTVLLGSKSYYSVEIID